MWLTRATKRLYQRRLSRSLTPLLTSAQHPTSPPAPRIRTRYSLNYTNPPQQSPPITVHSPPQIDTDNPYNLANAITLSRIALTPITAYTIHIGNYNNALGLLLLTGLSDFLDGHIARRFNLRSTLGSYLDPLADKLLISTVTISLSYNGIIPPHLTTLIISRDILLISGYTYLLHQKTHSLNPYTLHKATRTVTIQPLPISKLNTTLQLSLATIGVITASDIPIPDILPTLSLATACTTVTSGLAYINHLKKL